MSKKRKKDYYSRPQNKRAAITPGTDESPVRPNLATINTSAAAGQEGLAVGNRVRIQGPGLFSGEIVTIERLSAGAIPSAFVRTASGASRQVRTIDLTPAKDEN